MKTNIEQNAVVCSVLFWFIMCFIVIFTLGFLVGQACSDEIPTEQAVRSIIGESSGEEYYGMYLLAVGIRNRGTLDGVYGRTASHIDKESGKTWQQASKAWVISEENRCHDGTEWGSTIVDKKWIEKMRKAGYIEVLRYKNHIFFKRP